MTSDKIMPLEWFSPDEREILWQIKFHTECIAHIIRVRNSSPKTLIDHPYNTSFTQVIRFGHKTTLPLECCMIGGEQYLPSTLDSNFIIDVDAEMEHRFHKLHYKVNEDCKADVDFLHDVGITVKYIINLIGINIKDKTLTYEIEVFSGEYDPGENTDDDLNDITLLPENMPY